MRNLAKANKLKDCIEKEQLDVEILQIDVTKPETIAIALDYIIKKDGKLDVLINNAVEGFTEGLASYVSPAFNIKFTNVEPGGISTEFMTSAVNKTAVDGKFATGEYLPIFEKYLAGTQQRASSGAISVYQTGLEVAQVILEVLESDNSPLRIRTSQWAEEFCQLKTNSDSDGTKLVNHIITNFLQ